MQDLIAKATNSSTFYFTKHGTQLLSTTSAIHSSLKPSSPLPNAKRKRVGAPYLQSSVHPVEGPLVTAPAQPVCENGVVQLHYKAVILCPVKAVQFTFCNGGVPPVQVYVANLHLGHEILASSLKATLTSKCLGTLHQCAPT
jgi:hypothetical protein